MELDYNNHTINVVLLKDRQYCANEGLQNLFGLGQFGTNFNPLVGPVAIQVRKFEANEAEAVLEQLLKLE